MDLKAFTESLPRGATKRFAEGVGVTPVYLHQIAAQQDGRKASPELCVRIEVASDRQVRRWDLRPTDWWLIWPELIDVEGAPLVPGMVPQKQGETPPPAQGVPEQRSGKDRREGEDDRRKAGEPRRKGARRVEDALQAGEGA